MGSTDNHTKDEGMQDAPPFTPEKLQQRLKHFFELVTVKSLQSRVAGWIIPRRLLPSQANWTAFAVMDGDQITRLIIPSDTNHLRALQSALDEQGLTVKEGHLQLTGDQKTWQASGQRPLSLATEIPLTLAGGVSFPASLKEELINKVKKVDDLRFQITVPIQGTLLKGIVTYRGLELHEVNLVPLPSSLWMQSDRLTALPLDEPIGEGILLPKSFRDGGVLLGDRGTLSYLAPTASLLQEQFVPVYVAGFYDPGIIPIGGKFIFANPDTTALIRSSHTLDDKASVTNGINVRFNDLTQAEAVKQQLIQKLKDKGIHRYWTVETYRDYEFTKEIMQELQSQKNLFTLIAVVIIIVACSNIISMLIILVNDKKTEIGILRSMGASSKSIALIFGLSGALIGVGGSLIGILGALITLNYLDLLLKGLSLLQGHDMFNASFYGQVMPHELSFEALGFVLAATGIISLLAGIVPAVKACLLKPSHILRTMGG